MYDPGRKKQEQRADCCRAPIQLFHSDSESLMKLGDWRSFQKHWAYFPFLTLPAPVGRCRLRNWGSVWRLILWLCSLAHTHTHMPVLLDNLNSHIYLSGHSSICSLVFLLKWCFVFFPEYILPLLFWIFSGSEFCTNRKNLKELFDLYLSGNLNANVSV